MNKIQEKKKQVAVTEEQISFDRSVFTIQERIHKCCVTLKEQNQKQHRCICDNKMNHNILEQFSYSIHYLLTLQNAIGSKNWKDKKTCDKMV